MVTNAEDATSISGAPIWAVALVLAAAAPWILRMLTVTLERNAQRRTWEALRGSTPRVGDEPTPPTT